MTQYNRNIYIRLYFVNEIYYYYYYFESNNVTYTLYRTFRGIRFYTFKRSQFFVYHAVFSNFKGIEHVEKYKRIYVHM